MAKKSRREVAMAVYVYRCAEHGTVEESRPIGTAAAAVPCPACGSAAARIYTAPRLSLGSATRRAGEHACRTGDVTGGSAGA